MLQFQIFNKMNILKVFIKLKLQIKHKKFNNLNKISEKKYLKKILHVNKKLYKKINLLKRKMIKIL